MARQALTDNLWDQLQVTMKKHGCYQKEKNREVMEAILWKLRTGAPWRDIPIELCPWKTAYNRFNRWSKAGLWQQFFLAYENKLIQNGCSSTEVIYGVINMQVELGLVKIEQLDKVVVEQLQRYIYPVMPMDIRSILKSLGVTVHDSQVASELIELIGQADYFIADKGYDSESIRVKARTHNMIPVIPKRKNAKQPNPEFDSYLYKLRHLVENMFARLKHFRSIATRYEKLARNFKSMLYLACTIIHCKMN